MVLVGYFYIFEKNKTMQRTETALVHQGEHFNTTSAVVSPIFQTSTYYADNDLDGKIHIQIQDISSLH